MSLDDLVALNEEIAGLVRAGVPLELGLAGWGRDVGGSLGQAAGRIAARVEAGQSFEAALASERLQIPEAYRAVVSAGLKADRLPAALESLATSARNLQDVRRAIGMAFLYPLLVVLVAYFLSILLVTVTLPAVMSVYEKHPPQLLARLVGDLESVMRQHGPAVLLVPPLVLVLVSAVWWWRTRSALVAGGGSRWADWLPVAGRAIRNARHASQAEILGLLIERGVPLEEAVVLAAECTGDQRLMHSAQHVAALVKRGAPPTDLDEEGADYPPMLSWLMASTHDQATCAAVARHVAETYRQRMVAESRWLRDYLPVWLVVFVGGAVALAFGLLLFLPFTQLLEALSGSVGGAMHVKP